MKKMFKLAGWLVVIGVMFACTVEQKSANYRVVPLPQEIIEKQDKSFVLNENVKIVYPEGNDAMQKNAEFLADYIQEATGKRLAVEVGTAGKDKIALQLALQSSNPEAYQLKVNGEGVVIDASTEAGVFYGIQTLRK